MHELLREVTIFLNNLFDYYGKHDSGDNKDLNKHKKRMFKNMKKSLKEEVGSFKKAKRKS